MVIETYFTPAYAARMGHGSDDLALEFIGVQPRFMWVQTLDEPIFKASPIVDPLSLPNIHDRPNRVPAFRLLPGRRRNIGAVKRANKVVDRFISGTEVF